MENDNNDDDEANIGALPAELLVAIFRALDAGRTRDVISLCAANRAFRGACHAKVIPWSDRYPQAAPWLIWGGPLASAHDLAVALHLSAVARQRLCALYALMANYKRKGRDTCPAIPASSDIMYNYPSMRAWTAKSIVPLRDATMPELLAWAQHSVDACLQRAAIGGALQLTLLHGDRARLGEVTTPDSAAGLFYVGPLDDDLMARVTLVNMIVGHNAAVDDDMVQAARLITRLALSMAVAQADPQAKCGFIDFFGAFPEARLYMATVKSNVPGSPDSRALAIGWP